MRVYSLYFKFVVHRAGKAIAPSEPFAAHRTAPTRTAEVETDLEEALAARERDIQRCRQGLLEQQELESVALERAAQGALAAQRRQAEAFAVTDQELQTAHAELAGKYSELKQVRTGRPETLKGDDPTSLAKTLYVETRRCCGHDLKHDEYSLESSKSQHLQLSWKRRRVP